MRLSTHSMQMQGLEALLRNQSQLARTQNQLASGQRMVTAADAPADAAQALSLDRVLGANAAYLSAIGSARGRLSLEEDALSGAGDVLQHVRELVLQANAGAQSPESRQNIATQMGQLLEQLVALANSSDGQGRYLFGGSQDDAPPFAIAGSGAAYGGDQSQRLVAVTAQRTLADGDAGSEVFQRLKSGNGVFDVAAAVANTGGVTVNATQVRDRAQWDGGSYTISFNAGAYEVRDSASALVTSGAYQPGAAIQFRGISVTLIGQPADGDSMSVGACRQQDVFATLQQLIALAGSEPATAAGRAQQQTALFGGLQSLDGAMAHISAVRASVGNRQVALDDSQNELESQQLSLQQTLSGLRDLDYAEASTRLNLQMTALQAAQQSYSRIQGLSLFDYLR